jgi:hypothetical protein
MHEKGKAKVKDKAEDKAPKSRRRKTAKEDGGALKLF